MAFRLPTEKLIPAEVGWGDAKAWLEWIFLKDWATKSVALVITLFLWFGVTGQRTPTTKRLFNVRLIFQHPGETEISNDPLNRVDITITGDKNRVTRLTEQDLVMVVDLSGYKPGDLVVQLKPDTVNLELPSGVRLDDVEPNKASLKLEPRIEKFIEVNPAFAGDLPDNLELYGAAVVPASVRVRGAASRINALDKLPTEKINLENLTENFTAKQITIDSLDPKITVLDPVVDVNLRIGEQRIEKTFADVGVRETTGAKASPDKAAVTLFGARSIIESIRLEDLAVELETAEDSSIVPRLILPPELEGKVELRLFKPGAVIITH